MAKYVIELSDEATGEIADVLVLETERSDELLAMIGSDRLPAGDSIPLSVSDVEVIVAGFELAVPEVLLDGWLRVWSFMDELPYAIHARRELRLMLAGEKPLAAFVDDTPEMPDNGIVPEEIFAPYVSSGRLVKREREPPRSGHVCREVLYAVPSDALGSTLALADATGVIVQRYQYDPYGNGKYADNASTFSNPYQYAGREADTATLYYYRARYYSPELGRFLSEDPMGFGGGQANFYAYAEESPLIYTDPYGLWTLQFGFSYSGSIGSWTFGGSLGLALDGCGTLATYDEVGTGVGVGEDIEGGLSIHATSGDTVQDLSGLFNNAAVSSGDGLGATLDGVAGYGANHQPVVGGGITVGPNIGAVASDTVSNTNIHPVAHLW